jgi:hypothetical protein
MTTSAEFPTNFGLSQLCFSIVSAGNEDKLSFFGPFRKR